MPAKVFALLLGGVIGAAALTVALFSWLAWPNALVALAAAALVLRLALLARDRTRR